jgi:hypothetical protein
MRIHIRRIVLVNPNALHRRAIGTNATPPLQSAILVRRSRRIPMLLRHRGLCCEKFFNGEKSGLEPANVAVSIPTSGSVYVGLKKKIKKYIAFANKACILFPNDGV